MKTCSLLALLLWASTSFSQAFYKQSFGTGGSFPTGWSSTDSRISLNSTVPSSGYSSSATSPEASGGNNVIFQLCTPNTSSTLYLNCAGVVNTTGKSNIRVGFGRRKTVAFDKTVSFEYSIDGASWVEIDADVAAGGGTTWDTKYYDLPSEAPIFPSLKQLPW